MASPPSVPQAPVTASDTSPTSGVAQVPATCQVARPRWADRWLLVGIIAWFLFVAALYSLLVPLWEAPDEPEHFAYVRYVAIQRALPDHLPSIQIDGNEESKQPPLYYVLAIPFVVGVDVSDADRIRPNPRATWPNDPAGTAMALHVQDEGWPYHGVFLAAHRARLLSVLLGAAAVALTFAIARQCTGSVGAALLAAAFVASLPGFIFASATIDNDTLLDTLSAATLWVVLRESSRRSRTLAFLFGLLGCLALLTKLDAVVEIGVGLAALVVRAGRGQRLQTALLATTPLVPALLFWLWRIANGQHELIGRPVSWPASPGGVAGTQVLPAAVQFAGDLVTSFFGVFGWQNVAMPALLYALYGAIFAGGLILAVLLRRHGPPLKGSTLLVCWTLAILASMIGAAMLVTGSRIGYDHARFLYPALPAIATLCACGWQRGALLLPRLRPWLVAGLGLAWLLALLIPWLVIRPAYVAPAPITDALPATTTAVATNSFNGTVELAGVQLPSTPVGAGQGVMVRFYWRVSQPLPDGTWLFVHMEDGQGRLAAAFDGAPLYGTIPLSFWRRSDVVIDQELLTMHPDALTGTYQVRLGWYDHATGVRVPLVGGGNELVAGTIEVAGRSR